MSGKHTLLPLAVLCGLASSCSKPENSSSMFTALSADECGIHFVNANKETEKENIIAYEYFYNGGGVAIGDINNDGLQDIFFTANQGGNKLYLNKGNLTFEDITARAGVAGESGWKTGASMVDINSDGLLDIYVCRSGNLHELFRSNSFYINKGNLKFVDESHAMGLDDNSYSTQSAFFDFDRDGDLDVFILNHSRLQISNSYDPKNRYRNKRVKFVGNRFFRNDRGKFVEISDSVGVYGPASNYGLGVCYDDMNNDGWLDLYLSNDYTEKDKLLINEQGKFFSDHSNGMLSHISQFSMGVDIADINNDGLPDIISTDMLPESNQRQKEFFWPDKFDVHESMVSSGLYHQYMRNMLHLNNGDGTFSEIGQFAGIAATDWSWAPLFADFDNDGLQDLFIANGFKRNFTANDFLRYQADLQLKGQKGERIDNLATILGKMPSNAAHNYIFKNEDGLRFSDRSSEWGFVEEDVTNGAAYADLDNDGDLDLVVNNIDKPAQVYRNNAERSGNHFLTVKLHADDGNTFGLGAKVSAYMNSGQMTRTMCPYRGFQSSVEPALHFGLGKNMVVDSVVVWWPTGEKQTVGPVRADEVVVLDQKNASLSSYTADPRLIPLIAVTDSIAFSHRENTFVDFKVQALLPRMYSTLGPALAVGDINGDQLDDIFVGGARGQVSQFFLGEKDGKYKIQPGNAFSKYSNCEDVDAVLFDMDGDRDLDLYVVTGGYEFDTTATELQDHLFRNNGRGVLTEMPLPTMLSSGSCVKAGDADGDGDPDLFVGGRIVPGRYPQIPDSYILINDGKGIFTDQTNTICGDIRKAGLVTDAIWADVNGDRADDLVVVGEWMPVRVFIQSKGRLVDHTSRFNGAATRGWWNCVRAGDFDNDGDLDLVAGNFGMNNQYRPDSLKPVNLYYADYDRNGSIDPLMEYFIRDRLYPMATRDELTDQLPSFRKRFPDYATYTNATMQNVLSPEELNRSRILTATQFQSCYLENTGGTFVVYPLPQRLQLAPVCAMEVGDFNNDGHLDVFVGGNVSSMGARFGKVTGLRPTMLSGDGSGGFRVTAQVPNAANADLRKLSLSGRKLIGAYNNASVTVMDFPSDGVK